MAASADVIVAALGESAEMSGESSSRTDIQIPDAQKDLLKALVATGKAGDTGFVYWSSARFVLGV